MRSMLVLATLIGIFCAGSVEAQRDNRAKQVVPKGAQYTIFCARIEGDAHVERANRLKSELAAKTGATGWYVVHESQQSLLYYGFYRAFNDLNDKKESQRAQGDLKSVKALLPGAVFVNLDAPDPAAPPEWNLVNAPGVWSLQIAAYKDSPLRKEAAVDAVREARKQGVDAYYYHGETVSSVCIGVWPEEAVQIDAAVSGKAPLSPTDSVLVAPADMPNVQGVKGEADVRVVKEEVRIIDQTLLATMQQYPYHAINGMQTSRRIDGREVPDPSLLVRIPQAKPESPGLAGAERDRDNRLAEQQVPSEREYQPAPKPQPPPPTPGLGKLKSVDD